MRAALLGASRAVGVALLLVSGDVPRCVGETQLAYPHYRPAATVFAVLDARNAVQASRASPPLADHGARPSVAYGPPVNPRWSELFALGGPQWQDVRQGHIGDCYLMATLAALAHASPLLLKHNIRPNADGTSYTVTLFAPQGGDSLVPVHVRVDGAFPMRAAQVAYAATPPGQDAQMHADGKRVLWVALYEKAFGAFLSTYIDHRSPGYDALERTAFSYLAFGYLTGSYARQVPVALQPADDLWQTLLQANKGVPMTAGSQATVAPKSPVTPRHAYTVLQAYTDPTSGERRVLLRNPVVSRASKDGLVALSLHDFVRDFARLTVALSMAPAHAYASHP